MLSLPDFPIDFQNQNKESALHIALDGYVSNDIWMSEHFAYELIKKGACIEIQYKWNEKPLHCALNRSFVRVIKLLLERGVDVNLPNSEGHTPLKLALSMEHDVFEIVSALLIYGAEPDVSIFELSILMRLEFAVQEILFLYTFDEYSRNVEITLDVLLILANTESPLFFEIVKDSFKKTIVTDTDLLSCGWDYYHSLCSMKSNYLKILIEKYYSYLDKVLFMENYKLYNYIWWQERISLDNLHLMLESKLKDNIISFISTVNRRDANGDSLFPHWIMMELDYSEKAATELYCFLLSYGFYLEDSDLQKIYEKFGYCELFKILLHMDINLHVEKQDIKSIMAVFYYDVTMNLERFLENSHAYSAGVESVQELICYFVHPKLREIYCELTQDGRTSNCKRDMIPEVPLLVELARNKFRKFFIKMFGIETAKRFYFLIQCLPINNVYKRIITYDVKLY